MTLRLSGVTIRLLRRWTSETNSTTGSEPPEVLVQGRAAQNSRRRLLTRNT
jgi:hypothetical protein